MPINAMLCCTVAVVLMEPCSSTQSYGDFTDGQDIHGGLEGQKDLARTMKDEMQKSKAYQNTLPSPRLGFGRIATKTQLHVMPVSHGVIKTTSHPNAQFGNEGADVHGRVLFPKQGTVAKLPESRRS